MASARPASQGSGSEQETLDGQSRFVIPPAVEDCDNVPSPSQHRLPYASQLRQVGLGRMSDDQDHDDGTHSEDDEEDVEASNSSGGEEEHDEEEEEEECEDYDEEEQDGYASEAASSRAPSKHPSSQISLRCMCEICKLRLHICKRNLGRLQLMCCPFGT